MIKLIVVFLIFAIKQFGFGLLLRNPNQKTSTNYLRPLKSSNELSPPAYDAVPTGRYISNTWASINRGGLFNSFEVYTSQKDTQQLVIGQIANWINVEKYCDILPGSTSHSTIFASLDGERVIHNVGWKLEGLGLRTAFKIFRDRADSQDGTPAGLKESTHIYDPLYSHPRNSAIQFISEDIDNYPIYTIDVYACRQASWQDDIAGELQQAVSYIHTPELRSIHVLKSIDKLSCVVIGAWATSDIMHHFENNSGYLGHIRNAKKYAVHGTMTDLVEHKNPCRLFYVADVSLFSTT